MAEHIEIETDDLACSIDRVTDGISGTTLAVAEMQHEICQAEQEAAQDVCRGVSLGFFTLIKTQLLQKKVQVQSSAESQLLALRHFAQSLRKIKSQMGVDFERISLRYTKLFKTLSDALHSRIYALDRPVAEIVEGDCAVLDRRILTTGAPVVVVQQDSCSVVAELATTRCKKSCDGVLTGVETLIRHDIELNKAMGSIVRDVKQSHSHVQFVPVIVMESVDLLMSTSTQTDIVISERNPHANNRTKIESACFGALGRMSWRETETARRNTIAGKIRFMLSRAKVDKRVGEYVAKLLNASAWQDLGGVE